MVTLTQKEQMLLKDMKSHEEWCVRKYSKSVEMAQDPALKQLLSEIGEHERQNLNTVNQILSGQIPNVQYNTTTTTQRTVGMGTQQQYGAQQQQMQFGGAGTSRQNVEFAAQKPFPFSRKAQQQYNQETARNVGSQVNQNVGVRPSSQVDVEICYDLLNTEKFISGFYDTIIFECNDETLRETLNHIQTDEQHHGFLVYDYLKNHGGYNSGQ